MNNQMDKNTSNRMIKVQNTESEPKHIKLNDKSTKHKSEKKTQDRTIKVQNTKTEQKYITK